MALKPAMLAGLPDELKAALTNLDSQHIPIFIRQINENDATLLGHALSRLSEYKEGSGE